MNKDVQEYIEKYSDDIRELYLNLRKLVLDSVSVEIEEKLWAKLPSYYVGENFVRLIPFKDHINIEAKALVQYKDKFADYKMTPKGMLQVFVNQDILEDVLLRVFRESLLGEDEYAYH